MENLVVTFCYLWQPPTETPFQTLITLLPVTFSQLDPQLGVGWGKRLVLCLTVTYLAGWHLE